MDFVGVKRRVLMVKEGSLDIINDSCDRFELYLFSGLGVIFCFWGVVFFWFVC